ncbi:glycosyltransferase family 39 protein [Oscillatoria laete-virens NRMC-F 0139]|nr:glycosyltransferase family 39 protein [Oscillatoria laete-virens NRMC-F 0139]
MMRRTRIWLAIYGKPLLVLFLVVTAVSLVTQPWRNYLTMDDWTTAASVRALVEGGKIQFIEWTTHFYLTMIFWGALFCLPFGFSLGALHLSTLCMAVIGLWAFYGVLRELGIHKADAWFGVALMGFVPPFFLLAHSFMDEIPFWSLMMASGYFYIVGQKRQDERLVWIAVALNLLAFFIKVTAIVWILALLIYRVTHRKRLYFDFYDLLPVLGFGLAGGLLYHFSILTFEVETSSGGIYPTIFTDYYRGYLSDITYKLLGAILNIAFLLLPLSVAIFDFRRLRGIVWCGLVLATACVAMLYHQGAFPPVLNQYNVFNLWELGQSRTYIAGEFGERVIPYWFDWMTLALALSSASVLIHSLLRTLNDYRRLISDVHLMFYLQGFFLACLMVGFWRFSDQYYIMLLPVLIYLGLGLRPLRKRRIFAGSILVGGWAVVSMTGTLDHIAHQKALEESYTYLASSGVPLKVIDAGYTVNGWYAYAAQKPFALRQKNETIPVHAVTAVEDRAYWILSKRDLPGYKRWKSFRPDHVYWAADNDVHLVYYNYEPPSEKKKKTRKKNRKPRKI